MPRPLTRLDRSRRRSVHQDIGGGYVCVLKDSREPLTQKEAAALREFADYLRQNPRLASFRVDASRGPEEHDGFEIGEAALG